MKIITKAGFTLIELLVVITIIGILATGATTVYTSQIQKARDSVRLQDIKALQAGIEQVYQDSAEYPSGNDFGSGGTDSVGNVIAGVKSYVPKIPSDPKTTQDCNDIGGATECGYTYYVGDDQNGINNGSYEIATAFENTGNVNSKAGKDGGDDDSRLEFGLDLDINDSSLADGATWSTTTPITTNATDVTVVIDGGAFDIN